MALPGVTSFVEQVGAAFEVVDTAPSSFVLKLARVVEHSKTENHEAFSAFFHGPVSPFMPQGTCKLRHPQFGEMDIFLVPVAKTNTGFEYEAAFNYIRNRSE